MAAPAEVRQGLPIPNGLKEPLLLHLERLVPFFGGYGVPGSPNQFEDHRTTPRP